MKRTLSDKYTFNQKRKSKSPFSSGYCMGVNLYKDYSRTDAKAKVVTSDFITHAKDSARHGDSFSKGVMCGVRDAANDRKGKR